MELCLRSNDPTQTLLMTTDGTAMYQVNTSPSPTTTISRFENSSQLLSTGRVACVVGEVDSNRLRLLHGESPMEVIMAAETQDTASVDRYGSTYIQYIDLSFEIVNGKTLDLCWTGW